MFAVILRFSRLTPLLGLLFAPLHAGDDIVHSRIAGLRDLGAAFKNVNDELKSDTPQLIVIQLAARQIRDTARNQYNWFPAGSGPQPGVKTRAKSEVWTRAGEFKTAQDSFATEAAAFFQVVAGGDVANIRARSKLLGAVCKNCHETFRAPEED